MGLIARLWLGEAVDRPLYFIRQVLLGALTMAGLLYFAAIVPSTHFRYIGTYERATFTHVVTVAGSADSLDGAIRAVNRTEARYAVTTEGAFEYGPAGASPSIEAITLVMYGPPALTYFSPGLLISGTSTQAGWGVDASTARRLRLTLGESVTGRLVITARDGTTRRQSMTGIITSIYAPTREVSGFLSPQSPDLDARALLDGGMTARLFVQHADTGADAVASSISSLGDPDVSLADLPAELHGGRQRFESALARNTRFSLIWISLALYAVYTAYEQRIRLQRRQKRLAILVSLGMTPRALSRQLSSENLLHSLTIATLGVLVCLVLLRCTDVYVPPDTWAAVALYAIGVNMALLAADAYYVTRRLKRLPVASLLGESV